LFSTPIWWECHSSWSMCKVTNTSFPPHFRNWTKPSTQWAMYSFSPTCTPLTLALAYQDSLHLNLYANNVTSTTA
jgi:hypothetical protein